MKIDGNGKLPTTIGSPKPEASHGTDQPPSQPSGLADKLELSTKKGSTDRSSGGSGTSSSAKDREHRDYLDKVELSTKGQREDTTKEKVKTAPTITKEMVDALPKTVHSQTYNARAVFAALGMAKSQFLDVTV